MSRFLTRDVDTTLEFDTQIGSIEVHDDNESTAILLTPQAAVNLASGLLQYATQAIKAAPLHPADREPTA